jgi:predicted GIY-YIG superfamily endonuclease
MSDKVNVLYRFYSAAGELLYVGITNDPWRRFSQHRSQKDWWSDVSTICQQSFNTLDELKSAEKKAIQSESPRYNKQFASSENSEVAANQPEGAKSTLVNKFFHTWRDQHGLGDIVRNGRAVLWQGRVIDQLGQQEFLIQLFSWLDGSATDKRIALMTDMFDWTFYENSIEMSAALGCGDHTGRNDSRCGNKATYMVGFVELGLSAACNLCASHYAEARPILWRNGIAELGNAPLSRRDQIRRLSSPERAELRALKQLQQELDTRLTTDKC